MPASTGYLPVMDPKISKYRGVAASGESSNDSAGMFQKHPRIGTTLGQGSSTPGDAFEPSPAKSGNSFATPRPPTPNIFGRLQ